MTHFLFSFPSPNDLAARLQIDSKHDEKLFMNNM